MSRRAIISVSTFCSFTLFTIIVILLAEGYRLDRQTNTIYGTGILVATSNPTGASLTLNDEVRGATNTTINNLTPGTYRVSITKEGYFPWTKEVEIEKSKVLTLDALMIPVSPSLAPITSTPANRTWLSPDGQKLAYTVAEGTSAGIWMLDLSSQPFNLVRKPLQVAADSAESVYSQGEVRWSPSSKDLLVTTTVDQVPTYHLISIDNPREPKVLSAPIEPFVTQWDEEANNIAMEFRSNFSEEVRTVIDTHRDNLKWSPDNLKFLYSEITDDKEVFYAYNKETKKTTKVLERPTSSFAAVRWYADSLHLLVLEKESREATNGSVSLVGMDGTNKQQLFRGTLIDDVLYTYLNGAKLVILTSFNLQEQTHYLYAINLR